MELLQTILGILVAVGIIIGYLRATLSTLIHAIVDKMFMEHKQSVDQLFNEQKLLIDRQMQTLTTLDKAISKLTGAVDKINEQQHEVDKELTMLTHDLRALQQHVEENDARIERLCMLYSNGEHKGEANELIQYICRPPLQHSDGKREGW